MNRRLTLTALLVADYDEAIRFYVDLLGFTLEQDIRISDEKRWVVVTPSSTSTGLLLAKAANGRQKAAIGEQSGGQVFLFLETDDFERDYASYRERGVRFVEEPRHEAYGTVAVFEDLYSNRWDLIGPVADNGSTK
ncbi:VOC family protein [Devosia aurantiaca]|uniref:VOC family protein n=1 Tax=Devosia aurantiaca TaxID=2714858 RepID=A0A6M1SP77_9HYPH|nr:VOC family protein [Devosia aurantiaca]NGP17005.1 VOC family protein [Devosia aurantiaca]